MRTLLGALLILLCATARSAETPPPPDMLDTMIAPTALSSVAISPDGKHLAAIGHTNVESALFLIDADTLVARTLVAARRLSKGHGNKYWRQPIQAHWVSPEWVAVDFNDRTSEIVDLAGKTKRSLGERFISARKQDGVLSDRVLVFDDLETAAMSEINVRTGETKSLHVRLPGKLIDWAFDANGALRAATLIDTAFWSDKTKVSNWYRASEQSEWQLLEETSVTAEWWRPLYVPAEPHTLLVHSRHQRDTAAIFRYDTDKREHLEVAAGHPREDIIGARGLDRAAIDSVVTAGIKPKVHWFEARWQALQKAVDAALPGRINRLSGEPEARMLVFSYSDVDPGRWFVLDTRTKKMWEAARFRPRIDPQKMLPMATIEYPSTDGLVIPAYLTRPAAAAAGAATPPMVVLIHGGPHVRDDWEWNEEVQILAARGYTVFQPQFRGSAGFGRRFEEAGYGQWGLAMQDDISAGVQHLIDQKIADPRRICIYGASYGGYAALWGLVKTPSLYKCGISLAGVSDVEYMLKDWSDRNADAVIREIQRARVGTVEKGSARFDAVSPLKHAGRIQVPLLLAHGDEDQRVPIAHSKKMVQALKDNGKTYEWLVLENEGHGIVRPWNQKRYYNTMLDFLDRHIGAKSPVAGHAAAPN